MKTLGRIVAAFALCLIACGSKSEIESSEDQLSFHQQPRITIESPALGAFVPTTADGTVEVSGTTRGSSLSVNGQEVAADGKGHFRASVKAAPGLNVIDAKLHGVWGGDAQRAFVYGTFAAPKAGIPAGVVVRSTAKAYDDHQPDLNDFSSISKAMLAQLDLNKLLQQLPPFTYSFGVGSVEVVPTGISMAKDKTQLALSPKAIGAHLDGSFSTLVLQLHLTLHLAGDYAANATVSVDTVGFVGDLAAKFSEQAQLPDPSNPGHVITGPGIVGSMARPEITLGTLGVTTDLSFPGVDAFVTWLANKLHGLIANAVADEIQHNAANHFAAALNQLGLPSTFDLRRFGVEATLATAEAFDKRTSFDDLGATISATTSFGWPSLPPGAPGAAAPGSLFLGSSPDAKFPPATFGVSVAFDALNQALFAVWGQAGLERTVLPAKNYRFFKLDAVHASPKLPPVLLPTADGRVQASLGDIVVTTALHTFFFDGPVEFTISATADVALDIDPATRALRITLSGAPALHIDINDLFGIVPDALLAPLSEVIQLIAPTIVQKVMKPIEVPLPSLPLSTLIQGSKASIGLAAPIAIAVDAAAQRVIVTGDLAAY